jgi:hypothetical protein
MSKSKGSDGVLKQWSTVRKWAASLQYSITPISLSLSCSSKAERPVDNRKTAERYRAGQLSGTGADSK